MDQSRSLPGDTGDVIIINVLSTPLRAVNEGALSFFVPKWHGKAQLHDTRCAYLYAHEWRSHVFPCHLAVSKVESIVRQL